MAIIRINDLPEDTSPSPNDYIPVDGASTRRSKIADAVNSGAPVASQEEAQAGTNNTKRMTPLTTKQSISSEVGVTVASQENGALAATAVQPSRQIIAGNGLVGGGDFSADRTLNVGAGTGISVTEEAVSLDSTTQQRLLPPGGTIGQALVKASGNNYATVWSNAGAGDMMRAVYDPSDVNANAFDRANHTGEQEISTITGLATALGFRLRVDAAQIFDATQRSQAMGNLGFSAFFKTLVDDADGAAMFGTMGATYSDTTASVVAKLPNGFIIQAGLFTGAGTNPGITFPLAFPNKIIAPFATMLVAAAADTTYSISIGTRSTTGMQLYRRSVSNGGAVNGVTEPFFWLALGD